MRLSLRKAPEAAIGRHAHWSLNLTHTCANVGLSVQMLLYLCALACGGQKTTSTNLSTWVLRLELGSSDFQKKPFTNRALSVVLLC